MQLIRAALHSGRSLPKALSKCLAASVLTLGNFDGVHFGHQQLLKKLLSTGKEKNIPTVVIVFEPQPQEFFLKKTNAPLTGHRLMRLREKCQIFAAMGVDYCVCLNFNSLLAAVSADDFVEKLLVQQLGMKTIVVGDDFHFGAKRQGTVELLQRLGGKYNYQVQQLSTEILNNERVSSSRVRTALLNNDFQSAEKLLTRPYFLSGTVIHGDARGRTFGFPTANIYCANTAMVLRGIFVVRVFGVEAQPVKGVANFGVRPMFASPRLWLEVFILNYNGDLYGRKLKVEFVHKLRDETHFDSIEQLIQQMHQDIRDSSNILCCMLKTDKQKITLSLTNMN